MDKARRTVTGRDELNIAEMPISLLADRIPAGTKTLTFKTHHGTLVITGSDDLGLPMALDTDVIVSLLHLTKSRNDFTDPKVAFSRHELIRLMGWPNRGRYYHRLEESLHRWVGVTLRYSNTWWNADVKARTDASFNILDSVVIYDREVCRTIRAQQRPLPLSWFAWGRTFFESCRAGNLKHLDLPTYFSLESAISKRVYRFLDKRFHLRKDWLFDLREFAFEHVGLSRNYTPPKLKEKLRPALRELEAIGFLLPMTPSDRYISTGRGIWQIRFVRQ